MSASPAAEAARPGTQTESLQVLDVVVQEELEATEVGGVVFDELPRCEHHEFDAVGNIQRSLDEAQVDAPGELYDEALRLARGGHLGRARDRLRMLLCLDPDDGPAHLLLAKVFAAQRRFPEAVSELDAAVAVGQRVPVSLRDQLEAARDAARSPEAPRLQVEARILGEVEALREETRRLRSENARLRRRLDEAEVARGRWVLGTLVTAVLATGLFTLGSLRARDATETVAPAALTAGEPAAAAPVSGHAVLVEGMVSAPAVAGAAGAALFEVDETPAATASAAPTAGAPSRPTGAVVHVVGAGDTLSGIARRYYGQSSRWPDIRDANRGSLGGGEALSLGMELVIPAP